VDDALLLAITAIKTEAMITCFHKHFDNGRQCDPLLAKADVGTRRLRYIEYLNDAEKGGRIKYLGRHKGV
jgi:hypothetical protein